MKITIKSKNKEVKNPNSVLMVAYEMIRDQVRAPLKTYGEFIKVSIEDFSIIIQQDDYEECSNCKDLRKDNVCLSLLKTGITHIIAFPKKESCTSHEKV